jgi:outer membrane receptor protein involved in Fe transport
MTLLLIAAQLSWAVDEVPLLEEVVVTASRIERPDHSYSNPVTSLTGDDIRASGFRDMATYLQQLPALSGSFNNSNTAGGGVFSGANGLTTLNLRNLGFLRTLVLVNGRRYVGSPFPGGSVVDIDSLPASLIERVEVMTGGASALYGADGVSGVVNFIMKDRYEGFEVSLQGAASSKHDAQSKTASMLYGTTIADGRGHLSLAIDYVDDTHLSRQRRDFSSEAGFRQFELNPDNPGGDPNLPQLVPLGDLRYFDFAPGGAVDVTLDGIPDFNGDGTPWDPGRFIEPFYAQGGDGTNVAKFLPDTLPDEESLSFNALFDFDLNGNLRFFSELAYNKRDSLAEDTPTFDYYLLFTPDSPFVPDAIEIAASANPVGVIRDHFDLGARGDNTERETYRGVLGLEGSFNENIEFEVSYTYGETQVETLQLNNRFNDRFAAALDATVDLATGEIVCTSELDPSAEPFNLSFQEWNDYIPGHGLVRLRQVSAIAYRSTCLGKAHPRVRRSTGS